MLGVIERWDMPIIDLITVHLTLRCIPKGHVDTPWIPWLQSIPIRFHPVFQLPPCHWQLGLPMIQWRQRFLDQHISDDISALEPLKTVKCILDRQECPSLIGSVWLQLVAAKGPSIGGSSIWTDWEFMQLAWRIQTFRTSLHYCIYEPRWFQWLCCCAGYFAAGAAFQPSFADGYGAGARSLALDWLGSTAIVSCQLSPHESLKWEGSYRQGVCCFALEQRLELYLKIFARLIPDNGMFCESAMECMVHLWHQPWMQPMQSLFQGSGGWREAVRTILDGAGYSPIRFLAGNTDWGACWIIFPIEMAFFLSPWHSSSWNGDIRQPELDWTSLHSKYCCSVILNLVPACNPFISAVHVLPVPRFQTIRCRSPLCPTRLCRSSKHQEPSYRLLSLNAIKQTIQHCREMIRVFTSPFFMA